MTVRSPYVFLPSRAYAPAANLIWPFVGIGAANLLAAIANYWFFRDVGAGEVDLSNMETQRQAVTKADAEAAVVEKKLADA